MPMFTVKPSSTSQNDKQFREFQTNFVTPSTIRCECGRTRSKRFSVAFFVVQPSEPNAEFILNGVLFLWNISILVLVQILLIIYAISMLMAKFRKRQRKSQRIPINSKTKLKRFVYDIDVTTGVEKESGTNLNVSIACNVSDEVTSIDLPDLHTIDRIQKRHDRTNFFRRFHNTFDF